MLKPFPGQQAAVGPRAIVWPPQVYSMSVVTLVSVVCLCAFMLALHIRHVCWGQPQLVLLSGTSTSTSPWEKNKTADFTEFSHFFFLQAKTWLQSDLWCCFFADLPPDRWGESCPHIGILGVTEKVKKRGGVKFTQVRDRHNNLRLIQSSTQHTPATNRMYMWVCECFWVCTAVVLRAAMSRDSSLNQRETRCTGHKWSRAQVDITHCNTWEKVQTWLWRHRHKNTHIYTHTYHNGTADSSCWWCLDPQPEFLHANKLEWVQYTTHTLLRQKKQTANSVLLL